MNTNAKLILIWILAGVLLAACAIYISKQDPASKVESFPDHSEIPNTQNFEQHIETRLDSTRDTSE